MIQDKNVRGYKGFEKISTKMESNLTKMESNLNEMNDSL